MSDATAQAEQFWLLTGEVPTGPFTLAQVHAELAAGRATWQTPACPVGGSAWLSLVQTAGIGPPVPPRAVLGTSPPAPTDVSAPASDAPATNAGLGGVFGARSPLGVNGSATSSVAAASSPPPAPATTDPNDRSDPVVASPAPTEPGQPAPSNRFWLRVGGETTGPFRAAAVRAKVQAGEVPPDAQARRVGTDEWVSLADAVGTLPPRPPAGAQPPATGAAAGVAPWQQKSDAQAPPTASPATAVEVRCGCGQLVRAEGQFAGQHVRCPGCKGAVAVPVASAAAVPPVAAKDTPLDGAALVAGGVIGLLVLAACSGYLPAGLVKVFAIGGGLAVVSGVAVLFGGKRVDPFR